MSNNETEKTNQKVTLTVFKESPHIWTGGLEGRDLVNWLLARANAILKHEQIKQKIRSLNARVAHCENELALVKAYSELGVYQQESSPTQLLSREAIQYDVSLPCNPDTPGSYSQILELPMACHRYQQLPDLREAERKYQETQSALLSQPDLVRDWFSKKEGD